jgi:hypothetical protein
VSCLTEDVTREDGAQTSGRAHTSRRRPSAVNLPIGGWGTGPALHRCHRWHYPGFVCDYSALVVLPPAPCHVHADPNVVGAKASQGRRTHSHPHRDAQGHSRVQLLPRHRLKLKANLTTTAQRKPTPHHALWASESCQRICQRDRRDREPAFQSPRLDRPAPTPSQLLPPKAPGLPFVPEHPARSPVCHLDLVFLQQQHRRQCARRRRFLRASTARYPRAAHRAALVIRV